MGKFNMDSKIKDIIQDERAREIIDKYIPGILENSQLPLFLGMKAKSIIGKGHYIGVFEETEKLLISEIMALEEEL